MSLKVVPFKSLGVVSYSSSIVTMAVSVAVFDIFSVILEFSSSCAARPRHLTAALQTVAEDFFV